jgi:hypothetical protein
MAAASTLLYNKMMTHLLATSPALHYEIVAAAGKDPAKTTTVSAALMVDTLMDAYYASSPIEEAGHLSNYRCAYQPRSRHHPRLGSQRKEARPLSHADIRFILTFGLLGSVA